MAIALMGWSAVRKLHIQAGFLIRNGHMVNKGKLVGAQVAATYIIETLVLTHHDLIKSLVCSLMHTV